jgi:hypothetical protein
MRHQSQILFGVVLLSGLSVLVNAQWLNYPTPGLPRLPDGKPDLNAVMPHRPDGTVDFTGVWFPDASATAGTRREGGRLGEEAGIGLTTEDGSPIPSRLPDASAIEQERRRTGALSPSNRCLPHTIPDAMLAPAPFKFVQTPGLTVLLFEEYNQFRQIFTDGRPFPPDMQPAWFGYSIGRWEGDTFVIQTAGFNDRGWSFGGSAPIPRSEALRTTERFRRVNVGTLTLQVTVDDPKTFAKPWTSNVIRFRLLPDSDFIEHICENEKDQGHIVPIK